MSHSNNRVKEHETVHHLISRIAHRVYFLKDDERKDFLEIARRAAQFSGVQLLGWCVMGNHFHLLVFLPTPRFVDEQEVIERYGALKGQLAASSITEMFIEWRKQGETGERRVSEWLDAQRRRMYDVGIFMKIVKQWFTTEYNRRNGHKGTLWESTYFDRVVPRCLSEMAKCLAYIHLNPIRAAASDKFDGYAWSSYSAFRKGDPTATAGMHFIYGKRNPMMLSPEGMSFFSRNCSRRRNCAVRRKSLESEQRDMKCRRIHLRTRRSWHSGQPILPKYRKHLSNCAKHETTRSGVAREVRCAKRKHYPFSRQIRK